MRHTDFEPPEGPPGDTKIEPKFKKTRTKHSRKLPFVDIFSARVADALRTPKKLEKTPPGPQNHLKKGGKLVLEASRGVRAKRCLFDTQNS